MQKIQDYFERGLLFAGCLSDIASLPCRRTRDFRIDEYETIEQIDNRTKDLVDSDRKRRIKEHTKRIQKELRRLESSRKR